MLDKIQNCCCFHKMHGIISTYNMLPKFSRNTNMAQKMNTTLVSWHNIFMLISKKYFFIYADFQLRNQHIKSHNCNFKTLNAYAQNTNNCFSPIFFTKFASSQFDSNKFLKIEAVKSSNKYLEQRRIRVHPPPALRDQCWSRPSCPMWRIFKITFKIIQKPLYNVLVTIINDIFSFDTCLKWSYIVQPESLAVLKTTMIRLVEEACVENDWSQFKSCWHGISYVFLTWNFWKWSQFTSCWRCTCWILLGSKSCWRCTCWNY